MHVLRDYCTEGHCLASPACPPESVAQKAVLDCTRVDYGPKVTAADNQYTLLYPESLASGALVVDPATGQVIPAPEGTEHVGGCLVHGAEAPEPELEDPNEWGEPGTGEGGELPEGGEPGGTGDPGEGGEPGGIPEPEVPAEPEDPSGGFGDANWDQGYWG